MVPTGTSQVFEQIFRVSSMVGWAITLLIEVTLGGRWCNLAAIPWRISRLLVLIYFYYRQRNVRANAWHTESNAIGESNGSVVKRLFSLGYTCFYGEYYAAYGITYRYIYRPKRLMDIGYYLNEATTIWLFNGYGNIVDWVANYFNYVL